MGTSQPCLREPPPRRPAPADLLHRPPSAAPVVRAPRGHDPPAPCRERHGIHLRPDGVALGGAEERPVGDPHRAAAHVDVRGPAAQAGRGVGRGERRGGGHGGPPGGGRRPLGLKVHLRGPRRAGLVLSGPGSSCSAWQNGNIRELETAQRTCALWTVQQVWGNHFLKLTVMHRVRRTHVPWDVDRFPPMSVLSPRPVSTTGPFGVEFGSNVANHPSSE
eukprot:gene3909-biopygen3837